MCGVAPARTRVVSIPEWSLSIALRPTRSGRQRPLPVPVPARAFSGRDGRRVEEQGLGDRRLHRRALEGLGDEEGRLRPLAGEQPLREGRDEDDRHRELAEYVLDRVDAGTVVGELDVGK